MSVARSQKRREKREAAKKTARLGTPDPRQAVFARLRRRVRFVLLGTSLVGLLLLRIFHDPVAAWMLHYGFAARLALVLALLAPALLTWAIGLGELKDARGA
ncbi:MAG: hypothetical protein KF760_14735 [Candidatus Eremiobacteraeota bacterium]|nr:hypothetical protein [Candidatus Eremiobacteraeota bacterium]MCW5869966.1 hypothetical protein [Candidatus Eremiobacteraeota bacterium]